MFSGNLNYTLKSTKNNYYQRYNTKLYFFSSKIILPMFIVYFDTLRTCGLFYWFFFHNIKIFLFLPAVGRKKSFDIDFADGIVLLAF